MNSVRCSHNLLPYQLRIRRTRHTPHNVTASMVPPLHRVIDSPLSSYSQVTRPAPQRVVVLESLPTHSHAVTRRDIAHMPSSLRDRAVVSRQRHLPTGSDAAVMRLRTSTPPHMSTSSPRPPRHAYGEQQSASQHSASQQNPSLVEHHCTARHALKRSRLPNACAAHRFKRPLSFLDT